MIYPLITVATIKGYCVRKQDLSPDRRNRLVPVKGHSGAFALIPPGIPEHIPIATIENSLIAARESLSGIKVLAEMLPVPELITRTLVRREAVQSSKIEGLKAEVGDIMEFESTGDSDSLPPDVAVTLNYVKALNAGIAEIRKNGTAALNTELIKAMHRELLSGDAAYKDIPGAFRTIQNRIGGQNIYEARFIPPPASYVEQLMGDLGHYLNYQPEGNAFLSIVVRMAVAHAQFESIHPFRDGNGRTGRLLMPLMLVADGYPPIYLAGFLKLNQREYYDGLLGVQTKGEWETWIAFLSNGIVASCAESAFIAKRMIEIRDGWQEKLSTRRDSAARKLANLLIGYPVISVNDAKKLLDCSFPAANNAIDELVNIGALAEPKISRNRMFVAPGVIDLLNQPNQAGLAGREEPESVATPRVP